MEDIDVKAVFSAEMKDQEYIHEVSIVKRFLELWSLEPGFAENFQEKPEEIIAEYKIDVDIESLKILAVYEEAEKYKGVPAQYLPRVVKRYRAFINEKIASRTRLMESGCAPNDPAFKAWRGRQVNRCWAELGRRNASIIHAPVTFELSLGCSIGCPFCGVSAKKLTKIFRYTSENSKMWRAVLACVKKMIGLAGGTGTCYYASEPLDNPDYENFADDFFAVFGKVPQLTTAAVMRNPERVKQYLARAAAQEKHVHRFSLLSLEIARAVHQYFTPEDLLYVELLPQFTEAPSCNFANTGRARAFEEKVEEDHEGSTIACITGFIVNMAEQTVRLITPCGATASNPTGEILIVKRSFVDAEDFSRVLREMVDTYMQLEFDKNEVIRIRKNITYEKVETGIVFYGKNGFKLKFKGNDDISATHYHAVLNLLRKDQLSAYDIAAQLYAQDNLFPANTFFVLQKFIDAGLVYEPYEGK